jgi:iron complex transport system substrate-binding protein
MTLPRIVSLLPSATELVCSVGAGDGLVGISHECDFPKEIADLPKLTSARIDSNASSGDIDRAVRAVIHDALSIYAVDDELLRSLEPDVIVTQDLCDVCAVSLDDVQAAVARLANGSDVRIVSLKPVYLGDILGDVERVADGIGIPERGREVRAELQARIDSIGRRSAKLTKRPRVATIEWYDPVMLGGTWMPELIELAGGEPVGAEAGDPAPTIEPAELAAFEPDVVVVKPCGYSLERGLRERDVIERNVIGPLAGRAPVYLTDGNAFFNRPGPRIVESLEILAACTHPDPFEDFARKHESVIERLD